MLQRFYPHQYYNSTYEIDFRRLYHQGYRGVIFDVDNTLVPHGAPADKRSIKLFIMLKELGFKVMLLSNNKEQRVKSFQEAVGYGSYIFKAHKPSTKNYVKAMEELGTDCSNTLFIGDQLFTDVWGAKKAGITTYLVKPIDKKEEIQIVIKRFFEKIVLYFYMRKGSKGE
ncbi:MAG TPA: YqeG family HAD IIIA-type phosphatase [Lachnospiraceae bacterium]|nr:YqeG family HAD IIIA-type phosphatase [Lachnospiraceae bacterium]